MTNEDGKPDTIPGWRPVEIIPLDSAVLCADCNSITRAVNGHCLACGSASVVRVDTMLNR